MSHADEVDLVQYIFEGMPADEDEAAAATAAWLVSGEEGLQVLHLCSDPGVRAHEEQCSSVCETAIMQENTGCSTGAAPMPALEEPDPSPRPTTPGPREFIFVADGLRALAEGLRPKPRKATAFDPGECSDCDTSFSSLFYPHSSPLRRESSSQVFHLQMHASQILCQLPPETEGLGQNQ